MWGRLKDQTLRTKLSKEGASLMQAIDVLRHPDTGAGGIFEMISLRGAGRDARLPVGGGTESDPNVERRSVVREAWRCMMDYLSNGIPLIVEEILSPSAEAANKNPLIVEEMPVPTDERAHAILVNGMRLLDDPEDGVRKWITAEEHTRVDYAELPGRFVIHDIFDGPFTERVAPLLLKSAWVDDPKVPENSGISFLAVAPRNARLGISQVRRMSRGHAITHRHNSRSFWGKYLLTVFGVQAEHETKLGEGRYVTRLLLTSQVKQRYLSDPESEDEVSDDRGEPRDGAGRDLKVMPAKLEHARKSLDRLARRLVVPSTPTTSGEEQTATETGDGEKQFSSQRYWWCVEVREPKLEMDSSEPAHGYWRMAPALAYLWPIDLDLTTAKDQKPWIEIVFAGEMDPMHYQFLVRFEQTEELDIVITQHSA